MENYLMDDDEDYRDIFITQTPRNDNVVSLEDNDKFMSVRDDKYSDISDTEDVVKEGAKR